MRVFVFFSVGFTILAAGALAASPTKQAPRALSLGGGEAGTAARYENCLRTSAQDPLQAHETARTWIEQGGGLAARHCAAVAMIRYGRPEYAAPDLERLAAEAAAKRPDLAPDLYAQAAQAWLLAREATRALSLQSEALKRRPRDVDFLIDRAIIHLALKQSWEAIDDLNSALELAPRRADALVVRASAYRHLGTADLAEEDIARALVQRPNAPDALAERGAVKALKGDKPGARADWLRVLSLDPDSAAGDQARAGLESIDVKKP